MPVPAAPSNLAASAISPIFNRLTWTDNASDETGFYYQVALTPDFAAPSFNQLNTANLTSADDDSFLTDLGWVEGTLLYYRIRAFNGSGNSAWSNTAIVANPPRGIGSANFNRFLCPGAR